MGYFIDGVWIPDFIVHKALAADGDVDVVKSALADAYKLGKEHGKGEVE